MACLAAFSLALIIVFLESLVSLHMFAVLDSSLSVGGSRKRYIACVFKSQIASGMSCLNFLSRWGLSSCSLAALSQSTRIQQPRNLPVAAIGPKPMHIEAIRKVCGYKMNEPLQPWNPAWNLSMSGSITRAHRKRQVKGGNHPE